MKKTLTLLLLLYFSATLFAQNQRTINVIGDSYTANHKAPKEETWHYKMAQAMGMKYNNYGRNGACIAFDRTHDGKYNFGPAIYTKAKLMDPTADYVLIIAGHNDAEKIKDNTDSLKMFKDSLSLFIKNIRTQCPKAKIGYVTPWYIDRPGFASVCNTIREVCQQNNIPVLYNYTEDCIIKVRDANFRKKYFQGPNDTAHLNKYGHDLFLPIGTEWFNTYMKSSDGVSIAPYYEGKKAAVSFTYDDGLEEHYTLVAPNLEKRGFRGSFWIIGNMVGKTETSHGARLTWKQIKSMEKKGHDMGSHSWSHPNCRKVGFDAFMEDVYRNDSAFNANLGHSPMTFAYPYNAMTEQVINAIDKGRIGSRQFQTAHGQQNNKTTLPKMKTWLNELIKQGAWGVTMTHGITEGYDKWYHPEELWQFYDYVKEHTNDVWVGTFAEVMAYRKERDATFFTVEHKGNTIIINFDNNLNKKVFNHPLTFCIEQNGVKRYVNAKPSKGIVKITVGL